MLCLSQCRWHGTDSVKMSAAGADGNSTVPEVREADELVERQQEADHKQKQHQQEKLQPSQAGVKHRPWAGPDKECEPSI